MAKEAAETEERCDEVAGTFEGKKTAILEEAREVKRKASEMMSTYLDKDAEALDGFEFLTMAEAAEVGHWSVLRTLNQKARNGGGRGARRVGAPDPGAPLPGGPRGLAASSPPRKIRTSRRKPLAAGRRRHGLRLSTLVSPRT